MNKDTIRQEYLNKRKEALAHLRYEQKQKIYSHLRQIPEYEKAKTVMAYFSRGSEVPTKNLILELLNGEKEIALPRTNVQDKAITPYLITSLDDLEASSFGIMEPKPSCKICPMEKIGIVLVPGIAFDEKGGRLGYGLGFYDRFLASSKLKTAGLCTDAQIAPPLPLEPHDVPMDYIVSELRLIKTK